MEKKITSPVIAGLVISLMVIVLGLIMYFTGLYLQTWTQYLGFAILFGGLLFAVINHGKENAANVTFGKLFGFGFKTTTVIICIILLYTIASGYLFPEVKQKIIEMSREQALKQPGANESQIEQGMEMFEKNYTLFIIIGLIFWYALIGAITSLIGAAVTKKNPQSPFDNTFSK